MKSPGKKDTGHGDKGPMGWEMKERKTPKERKEE